MLKQKKSLKCKYGLFFFKRIKSLTLFNLRKKNKFKKLKKSSRVFVYNSVLSQLNFLTVYNLKIRIAPNNLFCYLMNDTSNAVLSFGTAGMYNINISKKNLKFFIYLILSNFFKKCKKFLKEKKTIVVLTLNSPIRIKKLLIRTVKNLLKKKVTVVIAFNETKCFNGCRAKKQIKRKRRFFRLYKNV